MALKKHKALAFLESAADDTPIIGGFEFAANENGFDACFQNAVDKLNSKTISYLTDINTLIKGAQGEAIMKMFKEEALSGLESASQEMASKPVEYGPYVGMYKTISKMWDNCTHDLIKESASVGNLRPIKALDYPVIVKENVGMVANAIIPMKAVDDPIIKRHIEQTWMVDNTTGKRWKYPQCFYNGEYKEIRKAGRGLPIKNTAVSLPLFNYDLITNLTDSKNPKLDQFTIRLKVIKAVTADGDEIPMNMYVNLETGMWIGGKIDTVIKKDSGDVEIKDYLTGNVDFRERTVTLNSSSGKITKVVFGGYLSNERNERHTRIEYSREPIEFHIEDGERIFVPYSVEMLEDYSALLHMDLYKKTYNHVGEYMSQQEDSTQLDYLDESFKHFEGLELDPLDWNSYVRYMNFNCDSTIQTTALPSEYIAKELKFAMDRFMIDLTEAGKIEDVVFNIFGNPKWTSLLGDGVKWTFKAGESSHGIRHNHSYGVLTTDNVSAKVISALKFPSNDEMHAGLRLLPVSTRNDRMTFEHYKYTTHLLTPADSNYRAMDRPGGEKTYICGLSRYTTEEIQGIQGMMTFSNAEFIESTMYRFNPTVVQPGTGTGTGGAGGTSPSTP